MSVSREGADLCEWRGFSSVVGGHGPAVPRAVTDREAILASDWGGNGYAVRSVMGVRRLSQPLSFTGGVFPSLRELA